MTFTRWGFIYLGTGTEDPSRHRAVIEHGGLRTTIVAVPDREATAHTAAELAAEGAQSLELCGAFGPTDVAQLLEVTGGQIPIGVATYGMESIPKLTALFAGEA